MSYSSSLCKLLRDRILVICTPLKTIATVSFKLKAKMVNDQVQSLSCHLPDSIGIAHNLRGSRRAPARPLHPRHGLSQGQSERRASRHRHVTGISLLGWDSIELKKTTALWNSNYFTYMILQSQNAHVLKVRGSVHAGSVLDDQNRPWWHCRCALTAARTRLSMRASQTLRNLRVWSLFSPINWLQNQRLVFCRNRWHRLLLPLPHFVRVVRRHWLFHDRDSGSDRVSHHRSRSDV